MYCLIIKTTAGYRVFETYINYSNAYTGLKTYVKEAKDECTRIRPKHPHRNHFCAEYLIQWQYENYEELVYIKKTDDNDRRFYSGARMGVIERICR